KQLADIKKQITWPVKAVVTDEVLFLDAAEEESAVIASADSKVGSDGYFSADRVSVRNRLVTGEVDSNMVTHIDAAPNQTIGANATLIPFIEKDRVDRALVGANQQKQAVPLVRPVSPTVGTGYERILA